MFTYFIVSLIVLASFFVLVVLRRRESFFHRQKNVYLVDNKDSYWIDESLVFPEDSFIEKNAMSKSKSILVCATVTWQSSEISQASLGGGHTYKFDTLFFSDLRNIKVVYFSSSVQFRLRRFDSNTEYIPSSLKLFLDQNNLSIQAGSWGAFLVKNKGPFLAEEVDKIVKEFMKLTELFDEN